MQFPNHRRTTTRAFIAGAAVAALSLSGAVGAIAATTDPSPGPLELANAQLSKEAATQGQEEPALPALEVSENQRFLVTEDGDPFFWLADTAWELFHRLDRADAALYLDDRAAKDFTVVQAVALAELDGLRTPNAYGDLPFEDFDPARPAVTPGASPTDAQQYDYWDHVDWIVRAANERGIYVAFLPTWGRWVLDGTVNLANAETYGRFLGERYRDAGIVWVLGGDRPAAGFEEVWRALARGIAIGVSGSEDYDRVLMSYHPPGGQSSSQWWPDERWLDFHMQQNGHCTAAEVRTWDRITADYERTPTKPVLDSEPLYENHPICFQPDSRGFSTDTHIRQFAYSDVFAGAFGHSYGHHSIWQMHAPERGAGVNRPQNFWFEAIHEAGSGQLRYLRRLIEARPFLDRIPDQGLIAEAPVCATRDHVQATRDAAGTYALVYSMTGQPFAVDLDRLSVDRVRVAWLNPRTGEYSVVSTPPHIRAKGVQTFTPPTHGEGQDWVLVLDGRRTGYELTGPIVPLPEAQARQPDADVGAADRAYNLNGRTLTIDGVEFRDERQAEDICAEGLRFENQSVPLDPPTDPARAEMIRSSVWQATVTLLDVPAGTYDLFLYVWEDNNAEDYTLVVDGQDVAEVNSGPAGHWERLGPFRTTAPNGRVTITTRGGGANLSGLQLRSAER